MCWFILWVVYMEIRIYSRCCNGCRVQWRFGGDSVYPWYEEEDLPLYAYYSDSSIQYLLGHWAFWNTCRSVYAWGKSFHLSCSSLHFFSLGKGGTNKIVLALTVRIITKKKKVSRHIYLERKPFWWVCLPGL